MEWKSAQDISDVIRMDCAILRNSYLTKTHVFDYRRFLWKHIEVSYLRTGACKKNAWAIKKNKVQWGYEQAERNATSPSFRCPKYSEILYL